MVAISIFQRREFGTLHRQPVRGGLFCRFLFQPFQVGVGRPFPVKFLLDAIFVHIDAVVQVVPYPVGDPGAAVQFNHMEPLIWLCRVLGGNALHVLHDLTHKGTVLRLALLRLLGFRVFALPVMFLGIGHHLVKVQVGKVFVQFPQGITLYIYNGCPVHLIHHAEVDKVCENPDRMGAVAGGTVCQIHMAEVGEVRLLPKHLIAVGVDEVFCRV